MLWSSRIFLEGFVVDPPEFLKSHRFSRYRCFGKRRTNMKPHPAGALHRGNRAANTSAKPATDTNVKSTAKPNQPSESVTDADGSPLSRAAAQRILYALMLPAMLMPLTSSMSRVALPIIRDEFAISADMTAWVATAFTLPFMILMPVYGRLSDGVGRRRLILAGIGVFSVGTLITIFADDLAWLMVGRAIQAVGISGMMPLGMALLSVIFPPDERGRALGAWSSVGPATAFVAPLIAGLLIQGWGWRASFVPPFFFGLLAFVAVYQFVPAGLSTVRPNFLRGFDWIGVLLLATTSTLLLFYLSSRPITGVEPLRDFRLLFGTLLSALAFVLWERRRPDPFIALDIFQHRLFDIASIGAMLRMFVMAGSGFLVPLYLVDVHNLNASQLGIALMILPGAMALMVRYGGQVADRRGSGLPVGIGFAVQGAVMFGFWQLPGTAPLWQVGLLLALQGLGVGIMLAALHSSAMSEIPDAKVGVAAGVYSFIRFSGMAIGTALAGVLLENLLAEDVAPVAAYQTAYLCFAVVSLVGVAVGMGLRRRSG